MRYIILLFLCCSLVGCTNKVYKSSNLEERPVSDKTGIYRISPIEVPYDDIEDKRMYKKYEEMKQKNGYGESSYTFSDIEN